MVLSSCHPGRQAAGQQTEVRSHDRSCYRCLFFSLPALVVAVSVSCCCCNKTAPVYSLTVPEVRAKSQGVDRAAFFLETQGRTHFLALSPLPELTHLWPLSHLSPLLLLTQPLAFFTGHHGYLGPIPIIQEYVPISISLRASANPLSPCKVTQPQLSGFPHGHGQGPLFSLQLGKRWSL